MSRQLELPLLQVLNRDGSLSAKEAADRVADLLDLPATSRVKETSYSGGRRANIHRRAVRWAKQNLVAAGAVENEDRGPWSITSKGRRRLSMATPGIALRVLSTDRGDMIWAEAMTGISMLDDDSVSLNFSSPPYPLVQQRDYGGWSADSYVDHLLEHCEASKPKLCADGSLVLNLGDVYEQGRPELSLYQEEVALGLKKLGYHFCGRTIWVNPSKPKTTPWVTKRRERIANGVETFWWWAPSTNPKANNRNVLVPYGEKQLRTIARGGELRKCSLGGAKQSSEGLRYRTNNGGSIPFNILNLAPEGSNSHFVRESKRLGLPVHPARMPQKIAEFFIRFLTEEDDLVVDPFAGSGTTAAACEALNRQWVGFEKCQEYAVASGIRLEGSPGFAQFAGGLSPAA